MFHTKQTTSLLLISGIIFSFFQSKVTYGSDEQDLEDVKTRVLQLQQTDANLPGGVTEQKGKVGTLLSTLFDVNGKIKRVFLEGIFTDLTGGELVFFNDTTNRFVSSPIFTNGSLLGIGGGVLTGYIANFSGDVRVTGDLNVQNQVQVSEICDENGVNCVDVSSGFGGFWSRNGSNEVYYDSANVGIGTNNPGAKLSVTDITSSFTIPKFIAGRSESQAFKMYVSDGDGILAYEQDETDGTSHDFRFNIDSGSSTNSEYNFQFNGSNAMMIREDGRVGIGVSDPDTDLEVTDEIKISGNGDAILTLEADQDNVTETDNPSIAFIQDGGLVQGRIGYRSGTNQLEFMNQYSDNMYFGTANSTRMTILGNGNVGIGNAGPGDTLDVNGTFDVSGTIQVDDRTVIGGNGDTMFVRYTNDSRYGYYNVMNNSNVRGAYFGYGNGGSNVNLYLDNASQLTISGGNTNLGGNRLEAVGSPNSGDDAMDRDYADSRFVNIGESINGDSITDGTIDSSEIQDNTLTANDLAANSVGTSEVVDNSLTATDLAANSVGTSEVVDNSLTANDLATNSVGTAEVVNNSLTSTDLASNSVTSSELASNSVTSAKITDGTITAADLGANSVAASEIATNAVGTAEILNNTITETDISDSFVARDSQLLDGIDSSAFATYRGNISSGNFNTLTNVGTYRINDVNTGFTNQPTGVYAWGNLNVYKTASNYMVQEYTSHQNGDKAWRTNWNGTWTSWSNPDSIYINVGESGDAIQDGTIDSSEIQDNTLTANDLAANSVGNSELIDSPVVSYLGINAANGYGMRFWNSDNYKIHMGTGGEYQYGPVTGYSIKNNMNADSTRGWTWGVSGSTPTVAFNTQGNAQFAGTVKAANPTASNDLTTKNYVDTLVTAGVTWKAPVPTGSSPAGTYGTCDASKEGWTTYNQSDDIIYLCNASAWVSIGSTASIPYATTSTAGKLQISGDLTGTWNNVQLQSNSVGSSELADTVNINSVTGVSTLVGDYGEIARSTDEWLRLNNASSHTSGVYIPNMLRADGGLRVGDDEGFYRGGEDIIDTDDNFVVNARLSVGTDPNSDDDVGDRLYNDGRYINVGEAINGDSITDNTIDSSEVQTDSLTAADLAANSVASSELAATLTYSDSTANATNRLITIDHNASGSDTLTADRTHSSLRIDLDSSATGGDTSNEHRVYGVEMDIDVTGDSDLVYGGYFDINANHSSGTMSAVRGQYSYVRSNGLGTVGNLQGAYNLAVDSSNGTVTSTRATTSKALKDTGSTNTSATMMGTESEVEVDAGIVTNAYAVKSVIDRDGGTITNGYLFHGDYQGTLPSNAHGVYIADPVRNYFAGRVSVGQDPDSGDDLGDRDYNDARYINVGEAISGDSITDNTIDSSEIQADSLTAADLAPNSVGSSEVTDNSLQAADLAANSVGASEIQDNSVGASEVATDSLLQSNLAAGSVASSEIVTGAVRSDEVEDNSLTAADLAANSVGNSELIDVPTVTQLNIASGDNNGIRFWSSDSYEISMGDTSEYQYGPVTGYSIKNKMNNDSSRGWTWGVAGATPVVAINIQGNAKFAGEVEVEDLKSNGSVLIQEGSSNALTVQGNLSNGSNSLGSTVEISSNTDYRGHGNLLTVRDANTEWFAGVPYTGGGYSIGYDATGGQSEYKTNSKLLISPTGNAEFAGTVTAATPTAASHLATKAYVDASGGGGLDPDRTLTQKADIGSGVNLNNMATTGLYHQNANAYAAAGSNYPVDLAGMLQVVEDGNMVYQTYHVYGNNNEIYSRGRYNGTWSAWNNMSDGLSEGYWNIDGSANGGGSAGDDLKFEGNNADVRLYSWSDCGTCKADLEFFKSTGNSDSGKQIIGSSDMMGGLRFYGYDGDEYLNGAGIFAQVDGTPGNDTMPTKLVFTVADDNEDILYTNGNDSAVKMVLDHDGNLGIGTYNPREELEVQGNVLLRNNSHIGWNMYYDGGWRYADNGYGAMWDHDTGNNSINLDYASNNTGGAGATPSLQRAMTIELSNGYIGLGDYSPSYRLELPNSGSTAGRGRANAWHTYSSRRWKENIQPIEGALENVQKLQGITYNWKQEQGGSADIGFVAEEVGAVFPEMVEWEDNGVDAKGLAYDRLTAVLVEAVKEVYVLVQDIFDTNDAQQGEIEELKKQIQELRMQMENQ